MYKTKKKYTQTKGESSEKVIQQNAKQNQSWHFKFNGSRKSLRISRIYLFAYIASVYITFNITIFHFSMIKLDVNHNVILIETRIQWK